MKNIRPYPNDSLSFHIDIVNNTRAENKANNQRILSSIKMKFDEHEILHNTNNLHLNEAHGFIDPEKSSLKKLYKYSRTQIQQLMLSLTTDERNRRRNTCPNCTINSINSFDHFIPKEKHPEFSVNPKNLIPSCTVCNGLKGEDWVNESKTSTIFLNMYTDILPNRQFLFIENIVISPNEIDFNFKIDNLFGIEETMFRKIKHHYTELDLLSRYRIESDIVIPDFIRDFSMYRDEVSLAMRIETIKERVLLDQVSYGFNYWKAILKLSLLDNEEFIKYFG